MGKIIAVLVLLSAMATPAFSASYYLVESTFRDAGCDSFKTKLLAAMEGQEIYVGWCSALENYLLVVECGFADCRVLRKNQERKIHGLDRKW
ncbi:MAG: hypothetical protein JMN27_15925 [gamma proteobacterium endosymbiont of Lamellibrachia anaximandri]|nr:hypothetical protein [gamma proteobacterium endosymbiont of Lamellibrachia anaximandri]MBL3535297.1 hypothetical protein [gamma proteobacterium endosymbiont of Lamellibrachia anaximandri]MBL3601287.1 hypothetical protein [gamma proteobacterium endosymbiont of Lamellibrachia anaximandri]